MINIPRPPVELSNARNQQQLEIMRDIIDDNVCPFCISSLKKYHQKEIIEDADHWVVTENQWPYEHTNPHLLLIAKKHVTNLQELGSDTGPAFAELGQLASRLMVQNNLDSASIGMRIGDPTFTGGSVDHLHAHLLSVDRTAEPGSTVRMKLGEIK